MGKDKGSFGYIKRMRRVSLLHTVILYLIAFFIYFAGKYRYSDYATMFSITAIVVCIPASMRLVSLIMFIIHRGPDEAFYERCRSLSDRHFFFDSVITTTGASYDVYAFFISPDSLIGYSPDAGKDIPKLEQHLRDMFSGNSLGSVGIKIFTDRDKFFKRALELTSRDTDEQKEDSIRSLISNLSL